MSKYTNNLKLFVPVTLALFLAAVLLTIKYGAAPSIEEKTRVVHDTTTEIVPIEEFAKIIKPVCVAGKPYLFIVYYEYGNRGYGAMVEHPTKTEC